MRTKSEQNIEIIGIKMLLFPFFSFFPFFCFFLSLSLFFECMKKVEYLGDLGTVGRTIPKLILTRQARHV